MKIGSYLTGLIMLAAGSAWAGVTTYADNFDDGARNKALWKADNFRGGRLVERNGRLYAYSGVLYALEDYHAASWYLKPVVTLVDGDRLVLEAVVRLPKLPLKPVPDAIYSMEIGFRIPDTTPERRVFVYFYNHVQFGRMFNLNVYKADGTSVGWPVSPPTDRSKYYFKMRYLPATGSVTLWCRSAPSEKWTRLTTIHVDTDWGLWPGSPVNLQAFMGFSSYKTRVDEPTYLYFDNFRMTHTRP